MKSNHNRQRIAVLASGGGTNLQALIDASQRGKLPDGELILVISQNPNAYALDRAKRAGIEAVLLEKPKNQLDTLKLKLSKQDCQQIWEESLVRILEDRKIDLIVLAGFLTILTNYFVCRFPDQIINIHPSLIPSFCGEGYYGLRVHKKVLEYGVKITGATVHLVNEIPDGGRILQQKAVAVMEGDTPEILQQRVMEEAEWILLPEAVQEQCAKRRRSQ